LTNKKDIASTCVRDWNDILFYVSSSEIAF